MAIPTVDYHETKGIIYGINSIPEIVVQPLKNFVEYVGTNMDIPVPLLVID